MKKIILIAISLIMGWQLAIGQDNSALLKEQKRTQMNKLSFMLGEWEGSGWIQMGQTAKMTFTIHETVVPKVEGLVYLVEGLGSSEGNTSHNAIALISWDNEKNKYAFESHTFDGRSANASATLEGNTFIWGFDTPNGGFVQYKLEFDDMHWHESGSFSPDGETWYPFMEMKLKKVSN